MESLSPLYKLLVSVIELPQVNFDVTQPNSGQVLSIPGYIFFLRGNKALIAYLSLSLNSAVAVEQIFPGMRNTESLRFSSLKPDTIRTFRFVKRPKPLRLARN